MDKLTSLFTTIGDILNATTWFPLIQWPFWTLLFILAAGGVYTARFEKGNMFCLGMQGALKLAMIYIVAAAGYVWIPGFMSRFSQLPFLSVSEEAVTMVNPLGLLDRWNTALPRVAVRLYFFLLVIHMVTVFEYKAKNFLTWIFFQIGSALGSVVVYAALSAFVLRFWPGNPATLHNITAIVLLLFFTLFVIFRLHYSLSGKVSSQTFQFFFELLNQKKYGIPFGAAAMSFLIVVVYLVVASLFGHMRMEFESVSIIAFGINVLMCLVTLYIFNRFYNTK